MTEALECKSWRHAGHSYCIHSLTGLAWMGRRKGVFVDIESSIMRERSTMGSTGTAEGSAHQDFLAGLSAAEPLGPGTVGVVVVADADEWAMELVSVAITDCDGVHVFVTRSEGVLPVAAWVSSHPKASSMRVHGAHAVVSALPALEELKRLRGEIGPMLGVTHAYVPAGIGPAWRRWLEGGTAEQPPINVVEVALAPVAPRPVLVGV